MPTTPAPHTADLLHLSRPDRPCAVCCAQREHEAWVEPAPADLHLLGLPLCMPHCRAQARMVLGVQDSMGTDADDDQGEPGPPGNHPCVLCTVEAEDDPDVRREVRMAAGYAPHLGACYAHERKYARGVRLYMVESGCITGSAAERKARGLTA